MPSQIRFFRSLLVGEDTFHWQLSQVRDQLFRDEEFTALYTLDTGHPSVPPSFLATVLLLQAHDKVSDAEAHRRARLMQLGLRQARYRERLKTEAQRLLTATVANLTRIWAQTPA